MKVYLACETGILNPFLRQLKDSIAMHPVASVGDGRGRFWNGPYDADIVHIHWPDALFRWQQPSEADLRRLEQQLKKWRDSSKLIVTVHNLHAHYRDAAAFQAQYDLTFAAAHGFIHLGEASLGAFRERYGIRAEQQHTVIPHGDYACFRDETSRDDARARLGLGAGDFVVLSFGSIRHRNELAMLLRGFAACRCASKKLVVAGKFLRVPQRRSWSFYRDWLPLLLRLRWDPRIRVFDRWIPPDDVQVYLNASDVLVIQRLSPLNSGNVALGFTFGKVVAGPDKGVVGEVLRETGNPTFGPDTPLATAIEHAKRLSESSKGEDNKRYATANWNWTTIAARHVAFYQRVLSDAREVRDL